MICGMDLASVVLDTEAVQQMDRVKRGMTLDDEHLMHDLIVKMRFDGKYLSERSTRKYFRKEHLMPDLFPRQTYESWEAKGQSEDEIAVARVQELLAGHEPPVVAPEVRRELERIMVAAEAALVPWDRIMVEPGHLPYHPITFLRALSREDDGRRTTDDLWSATAALSN